MPQTWLHFKLMRKDFALHLVWKGTYYPICFFWGLCLVQVGALPHTPTRSERKVHWCYLKTGQCLRIKKLVLKKNLEIHTTQLGVWHNRKGEGPDQLSDDLVGVCTMLAKNAAQWSGALAVPCWGTGTGSISIKQTGDDLTWVMLKAFPCNPLLKRYKMTS